MDAIWNQPEGTICSNIEQLFHVIRRCAVLVKDGIDFKKHTDVIACLQNREFYQAYIDTENMAENMEVEITKK